MSANKHTTESCLPPTHNPNYQEAEAGGSQDGGQ